MLKIVVELKLLNLMLRETNTSVFGMRSKCVHWQKKRTD